MKFFLVVLLSFALTACAGSSPFYDSDEKYQVDGATKASDPERRLGIKAAAAEYLALGGSVENVTKFANYLETLAGDNITGNALNAALGGLLDRTDLTPEMKDLVSYVVEKVKITYAPDLDAVLSPEKQRVLMVYVTALREKVDSVSQLEDTTAVPTLS